MTDPKPPGDRGEQQEQEKWYERTQYHILLFVGGIAYIGAVLWVLLDLYIDPQTSAQKIDLIQALGFILAGVAGAIGIYFTWRGQRITRESLERSREHTENQLQLTREGQITERFTKAIEQLGATDDQGRKSLELRLGGVYALERIARESEEDHWPIMEVLTAYVWQHARWTPEESQEHTEDSAAEEESEKDSRRRESQISGVALDADIQAILTVLRRRARSFGHGEPEPLNLHETNLTGAKLSGVDLRRANLSGVNLRKADLSEADLSEADLSEADLSEAKLWRANLARAELLLTNLSEADLGEADLRKANLARANLVAARFRGANLSEAKLRRATLAGATLAGETFRHGANLRSADLSEADLTGALLFNSDLTKANLQGANLTAALLFDAKLPGATFAEQTPFDALRELELEAGEVEDPQVYLSGATLWLADLRRADLSHAVLAGANLSGADLSQANLTGADLLEANLSGVAGADLSGVKRWLAEISPDSGSGGLPMVVSRNLFDEAYRLRKSADLGQADLEGADLEGADLKGANLSGARGFIQEQLESTRTGNKRTKLPLGLKPPAHWRVKTDEQSAEH